MSKQTAVEWLAEKYNYVTWLRNRDEISSEQGDLMRTKYLEEAKGMEKQQIEEAFTEGFFEESWVLKLSEEYYKENYEQK